MGTFNPDTLRSLIGNRGGFATTEKFEVIFSDIPSGLDLSLIHI